MKIKATHIFLENLTFFSYHGVLPQENVVGNTFIINLKTRIDFNTASLSDNLNDTINYADIYNIIKAEMDITSKLLEHVSGRIVKRLFDTFPQIEEINIALKKKNPPMGADIDFAGVEMTCSRD